VTATVDVDVWVVPAFRLRRERETVVAALLGVDAVAFRTGDYGRPFVEVAGARAAFDVNVSHSGDLGLVAAARGCAVGVDVEHHRRRDLERLAPRVFTDVEHADWRASPDPLAAFYDRWVRKEALLKAIGTGLRDLRAVAATPAPPGWTIEAIEIGTGISAAVAVPVVGVRITRHPDDPAWVRSRS
jgi:phosphopantetheinyl transferase